MATKKFTPWETRVTENPNTGEETVYYQCPEEVTVKNIVKNGETSLGKWVLFTAEIPTKQGNVEQPVISAYTPSKGDDVWVEAKEDAEGTMKFRQYLKTKTLKKADLF
jgi:hypothetical protein